MSNEDKPISAREALEKLVEEYEVEELHEQLCDMATTIMAGLVITTKHPDYRPRDVAQATESAFNIYNRVQCRLAQAAAKESPHELTCSFRLDERKACDCVYFFDQQEES